MQFNQANLKPQLRRISIHLLSLLVFLTSAPTLAKDNVVKIKAYDELYSDPDKGILRPYYLAIKGILKEMLNPKVRKKFAEDFKARLKGDNLGSSIVRIIDGADYDSQVKKGVEQRALALRLFLQDHFSKRSYITENIISEQVMTRILARTQEGDFLGLVPPDEISFQYGPDIIKDPKGQWRVIEDNPGFIGGPGDVQIAQDEMLRRFPELNETLSYRWAESFYETTVKSYVEQAKRFGGGRIVMYMVPPYPDNEDYRIRQLLKKHGVETVTPNSDLQLKVMKDGVYVFKKSIGESSLEKVSYVVMNGEHKWLDASHPVTDRHNVIQDARDHIEASETPEILKEKLKSELNQNPLNLEDISKLLDSNPVYLNSAKSARKISKMANGLTESILSRKVGSNYTPGIDFIGDKEFYLYVEDLIRFYLKEEPIIKNIETRRMSKVNRKKIYDNMDRYVVKKVDGRGGDAVWVGPKIKDPLEISAMIKLVEAKPDEYIVQEYTPLSVVDNMIVDLRVISTVHPNRILVSDVPWGRGLPRDGNGKVNLSDLGMEVVPFVVDGLTRECKNVLKLRKTIPSGN